MSPKPSTVLLALLVAAASVVPAAAQSDRFVACSYDGGTIEGSFSGMAEAADRAGVIARILQYTGLPANFHVVESPEVPNAAAMVRPRSDGGLGRIIAYNNRFMDAMANAARTDWASTSILAHEIGHHLCGHTLIPGGSQPPTELEADSFSGFVLAKMGASLDEAQAAMRSLPASGSATHPPRQPRLDAIASGFEQAKALEAPGTRSGSRASEAPARPAERPPQPPEREPPAQGGSAPSPPAPGAAPGGVDLDPILSASVPVKLDRFVYDEIEAMRPAARKALNDRLADHAARNNVEVIMVFARSLRGKTAKGLADHLMRQLSVGQADLSNGGIVLYCPAEKANAVSFMPGLLWSVGLGTKVIDAMAEQFVLLANMEGFDFVTPGFMEGHITTTMSSVFTNTSGKDWTISYTSLGEAMETDGSQGKMARIFGVVTSTSGAPHKEGTAPNYSGWEFSEAEVQTDDGRYLTVRLLPGMSLSASTGDKIALFGRLAGTHYPTIELNSYAPVAR